MLKHVESAKSRGLRGNVGYLSAWVRGSVGCVGQIFTWVAWVKIFFTWVIIFTWVAWVKIFCAGQIFLRESKFSA